MSTPLREAIRLDALNIEEKAAISAQAQRNSTNGWGYLYYGLGAPTAVLVAVSGLSAATENTIAAVVLAILATASASLLNVLNPSAKMSEHKGASCRFRDLENRVHVFYDTAFLSDASDKDLKAALDGFVLEWNDADLKSLNVGKRRYEKARATVRRDHRFDVLHEGEDKSEPRPRRRLFFWRKRLSANAPAS